MHELPWITIFGSRVRRFANDFHEWRNCLTNELKTASHGNECIILFLTRYFMSWTHFSTKNNYRSLISPLSLRTVFSYLVLWRHHNWCVTSHEWRVLELWPHNHRFLLHAQFFLNAILLNVNRSTCTVYIHTSENTVWICYTMVNSLF